MGNLKSRSNNNQVHKNRFLIGTWILDNTLNLNSQRCKDLLVSELISVQREAVYSNIKSNKMFYKIHIFWKQVGEKQVISNSV